MRKNDQTKGIFCLEGIWDNDLRQSSSVRSVLDLLSTNRGIDSIYRDTATREEFEFYLRKWVQRTYDAYPILYIASHGVEFKVCLGQHTCDLDEIANLLEGRCANRIVVFGSCSTFAVDKRHLKRFLRRTHALAICGYRIDVDWLHATAFELLLMSEMQDNEFSRRGIEAIHRRAEEIAGFFHQLEFRMVTCQEIDT